MPKEEWGTKRLCPTTGKRFYDLNADPIVSPYTGEIVELDANKKTMIAPDSADRQAKAKAAAEGTDEVVLEDDAEVDVDLDDDLLDDDDDDSDDVPLEEIADVADESED